jgi:hypothetical protein
MNLVKPRDWRSVLCGAGNCGGWRLDRLEKLALPFKISGSHVFLSGSDVENSPPKSTTRTDVGPTGIIVSGQASAVFATMLA